MTARTTTQPNTYTAIMHNGLEIQRVSPRAYPYAVVCETKESLEQRLAKIDDNIAFREQSLERMVAIRNGEVEPVKWETVASDAHLVRFIKDLAAYRADRANVLEDEWFVAGWCGRGDLAQKLASTWISKGYHTQILASTVTAGRKRPTKIKTNNTQETATMTTITATTETPVREDKFCGCGCGSTVPSKRNFKPGHDARRKGQLLVEMRSGDASRVDDAVSAADALGWGWLLEQSQRTAARGKKVAPKQDTPFSKVKIGRWTYDLLWVADLPFSCEENTWRVTYIGRNGQKAETVVPFERLS